MNNDFSAPNRPKEHTRLALFDAARQSCVLWSRLDRTLRCDWLELAGQRAPTLGLLRSHAAVEPHQFIGVDRDKSALRSSRAKHPGYGRWIHADDIHDLLRAGDGRLDKVGVFNYDTQDGVGTSAKSREKLATVLRFASRQRERLTQFLLCVNIAARRKVPLGQSAAELAALVTEYSGQPWTVDDVLATRYTSANRNAVMFCLILRYGFGG